MSKFFFIKNYASCLEYFSTYIFFPVEQKNIVSCIKFFSAAGNRIFCVTALLPVQVSLCRQEEADRVNSFFNIKRRSSLFYFNINRMSVRQGNREQSFVKFHPASLSTVRELGKRKNCVRLDYILCLPFSPSSFCKAHYYIKNTNCSYSYLLLLVFRVDRSYFLLCLLFYFQKMEATKKKH